MSRDFFFKLTDMAIIFIDFFGSTPPTTASEIDQNFISTEIDHNFISTSSKSTDTLMTSPSINISKLNLTFVDAFF